MPRTISKRRVGRCRLEDMYLTTVAAKMNWPDDLRMRVERTSLVSHVEGIYAFSGCVVAISWKESLKYHSISAFCSYPSSREKRVAIPSDVNEVNSRVKCGSARLQIKNFRATAGCWTALEIA